MESATYTNAICSNVSTVCGPQSIPHYKITTDNIAVILQ